jgi:drug/metabolite transporter (DMT)-like permease
MISILCGFGAAIFFASGSLLNSRATRHIDGWSVVAWVTLVGLGVTAPLALTSGVPGGVRSANELWILLAGIGNVAGLVLAAYAFRFGKVAVVAPILACEGALSAVIAASLGVNVTPSLGILLIVIVIGVMLAAGSKDPGAAGVTRPILSSGLASAAACFFGVSLYAVGRLSADLPIAWLLLPGRVVGVTALTIPLALARRLRINRKAAPLVVAMGFTEVLGITVFSLGARHNIVITSVLSSQFAPMAAVGAYVLFHERLSRLQIVGVAIIVSGVTALSVWS